MMLGKSKEDHDHDHPDPGQLSTPTRCWNACTQYVSTGSQKAVATLQGLVDNAEELEAEWCGQFRISDDDLTQPALVFLLPIANTNANTPAFRERLEMVRRMATETSYAAKFLASRLDPETLRRTALRRSGRKWPKLDPLINMLQDLRIITIIKKKKKKPSSSK